MTIYFRNLHVLYVKSLNEKSSKTRASMIGKPKFLLWQITNFSILSLVVLLIHLISKNLAIIRNTCSNE